MYFLIETNALPQKRWFTIQNNFLFYFLHGVTKLLLHNNCVIGEAKFCPSNTYSAECCIQTIPLRHISLTEASCRCRFAEECMLMKRTSIKRKHLKGVIVPKCTAANSLPRGNYQHCSWCPRLAVQGRAEGSVLGRNGSGQQRQSCIQIE